MLSKSVKDVFVIEEARLENQRREFDARLAGYKLMGKDKLKN